jgi:hypothetical protein
MWHIVYSQFTWLLLTNHCAFAWKSYNSLLLILWIIYLKLIEFWAPVEIAFQLELQLWTKRFFKAAILDFLKSCVGRNLQHYCVGDADNSGLGLPPLALADGVVPWAGISFRCSLYELKGLVKSMAYFKNPESAAKWHQSAILDAMNSFLAGRVARSIN